MSNWRNNVIWQSSLVFGSSVLYFYFILVILTGAPVSSRFYGDFSPIIFCLLSAAFWGSGLWAYLSSSRQWTVFLFFGWNFTSAMVIISGAFQQPTILTWLVSTFCGLLNPVLMSQTLYNKFIETNKPRLKWYRFILLWYVASIILGGLATASYLMESQAPFWVVHFGDFALILGNFFNLCWLFYLMRSTKLSLARNQIRTVLIGLAIPGLPIILLNIVPRLVWGQPIALVEMLLPLAAATPICFYYAIKQQQWLPIDLRISRWLLVGLIFSVVGMVYLQVIVGFTYLSRNLVLGDSFILAFVSLVLAVLAYAPLRKRVEQISERVIYGSNYDYREIVKELNTTLFSLTESKTIGKLVCEKLIKTLDVRSVGLVVSNHDNNTTLMVASQGSFENLTEKQLETLGVFSSLRRAGDWYNEGGLSVFCQPILHKGRFHGFIVLGSKVSGNLYGKTDLYLLETIASSLGITIENSLLLDQLREQIVQLQQAREEAATLNHQLTRVRDEEREALAYQLHDGVLQNLIFITRQSTFCAGLLNISAENSQSVEGQLDNLHNVAQASIQELRSICNGLYPIAVDTVGLLPALQWLCKHMGETHNSKVELRVDGIEGEQHWSNQLERVLFLTAQEAVNNSLKHAQPKSVQVSLQKIKGELWLEISDDGTGMLPNWDYGQFACEGHMGLVGMRMRVERLGGQFELFSEQHHGTTVHIRIPLEQQEANQPLRGLPRVVGEFELEPVDIETLVL